MDTPHVIILGGGPAGLGAAYRLRETGKARVTLLEKNNKVGGNAGSFELAGMRVDYGSHRLHKACDEAILRDIRKLVGSDLTRRTRHGRIRLRGRWIHFPLKPLDLALALPPSFGFGVAMDTIRKAFHSNSVPPAQATFATELKAGLGDTICRDFYFPYARKLWGLMPEELSATQARRRVSSNSMSKMVKKILTAIPGGEENNYFYYPQAGYGQISEAFYHGALELGAQVRVGATVTGVSVKEEGQNGFRVAFDRNGQPNAIESDYVWSTVPISLLARLLDPAPPNEILQEVEKIDYRAMILVYLVIETDRFSEFDAHYFPELSVPISRLSEPKNYSGRSDPADRTVLCAEIPCSPTDSEWQMEDGELGRLVLDALSEMGIPVHAPLSKVDVRRLRFAYPIYRRGYELPFERLDQWLAGVEGLLTFGRQGLFAHDNTHHALYMSYSAVECLGMDGKFDGGCWADYRREFESHVVED